MHFACLAGVQRNRELESLHRFPGMRFLFPARVDEMASNPQPNAVPESGAALWLAVGRLQSDVARLIEGQSEVRTELGEITAELMAQTAGLMRRTAE